MVDKDTLRLSDIDLEFITTNSGVRGQKINPER